MATNLLKFCTIAFVGSLLGITYERWPAIKSDLFKTVTADHSPLPFHLPKGSIAATSERANTKPIAIDPKVAAENLRNSSRFGLPSDDNLRVFNDFVLSYDRRLRSPIWVLEHLYPAKLNVKNNVSRKYSKFVEDVELHEYFRATLKDFRGSHYDRGHMAAAANHKLAQDDLDHTFVLTNISPQEKRLNSGAWERLETYVRWLANRSKNLYVVTGPLYLPHRSKDGNLYVTYKVIGHNMVSVPTHYFKVFLSESDGNTLSMEAFLMPNDRKMTADVNLDDFRVAISKLDMIERSSGVIFFDKLNKPFDTPSELPIDYMSNLGRSNFGL